MPFLVLNPDADGKVMLELASESVNQWITSNGPSGGFLLLPLLDCFFTSLYNPLFLGMVHDCLR